jgi:hypothetical protein
MLEKHIRPLADRTTNRYDAYLASLVTPGVMALMMAWDQEIQQLYKTALAMQCSSRNQEQQHLLCQAQCNTLSGAASAGRADDALSLGSFLEFLQDHDVIPRLLEPSDVQEVLKRLLCRQASLVRLRPARQQVQAVAIEKHRNCAAPRCCSETAASRDAALRLPSGADRLRCDDLYVL